MSCLFEKVVNHTRSLVIHRRRTKLSAWFGRVTISRKVAQILHEICVSDALPIILFLVRQWSKVRA
jgi:hypothetical protein